MDNMFETGLEKRKATLGAEYVDGVFENADEFSRPFQEAMTAWCWGFGWGDEAIDAKTRSMMNLAMIGALGKMHEWELHCRGAIGNGATKTFSEDVVAPKGHLSNLTSDGESFGWALPGRSVVVVATLPFRID